MIEDEPQRYTLANELHARPFPALQAPCRAASVAIMSPDGAGRDKGLDRAHLLALLDRFGAQHPQPDATHFYGEVGRYRLKWESHTEFMTYTLFADGVAERPFDGSTFHAFPEAWLDAAPGQRVTSSLIRVEVMDDVDLVIGKLSNWFVAESLAISEVVDRTALVASDFRIDPAGHIRMAVFVQPDLGPRRVGRIVQRLAEIEDYKSMSMLGLATARQLAPRINAIEGKLSHLVGDMTGTVTKPEETLKELLQIAADLENLAAKSSFRFGATGAYEALVSQRIDVMREGRFNGRQTFGEFMMRRFDPAMRTVKSAEARLGSIANRAIRAGDLLRTRVDVERSAENQMLLESMDRRADLQLRLQQTVEGLSVVAISYYAVNLAVNILAPLSEQGEITKVELTAIATPVVFLAVWFLVRRIRNAVVH